MLVGKTQDLTWFVIKNNWGKKQKKYVFGCQVTNLTHWLWENLSNAKSKYTWAKSWDTTYSGVELTYFPFLSFPLFQS